MTRQRAPSAEDRILDALSPYLAKMNADFVEGGEPTVPFRAIKSPETGGRYPALNLTKLIADAGLKPADQKWFHQYPSLRSTVNDVCGRQGVIGIGEQQIRRAANEMIKTELIAAKGRNKSTQEQLTEALSRIEDLTSDLKRIESDRDHWRAMIDEIYAGGSIPAEVLE